MVETHAVSREYFRAMGVRFLEGRNFDRRRCPARQALDARFEKLPDGGHLPDAETNAMVYPAVINQAMARAFWPNRSPSRPDVLAGQRQRSLASR